MKYQDRAPVAFAETLPNAEPEPNRTKPVTRNL